MRKILMILMITISVLISCESMTFKLKNRDEPITIDIPEKENQDSESTEKIENKVIKPIQEGKDG